MARHKRMVRLAIRGQRVGESNFLLHHKRYRRQGEGVSRGFFYPANVEDRGRGYDGPVVVLSRYNRDF